MRENLSFLHDTVFSGKTSGIIDPANYFNLNHDAESNRKHYHRRQGGSRIGPWLRRQFQRYIASPLYLVGSIGVLLLLPENVFAARVSKSLFFFYKQGVKRLLDITISIFGLIVTAPFFVILPILIKLDSQGPVFYRQIRVGKDRRRENSLENRVIHGRGRVFTERRKMNYHGQPFYVFKFRTMQHDAERKTGPVWAARNDPRITRLGRVLRKTHLDELPQFINVLRGEMSLVGPRPERPCFVLEFAEVIPGYCERFKVKPGMTGKAQIYCGYDTSIADVKKKLSHDIDYIKNARLIDDVRFILLSIWTMFARKGDA